MNRSGLRVVVNVQVRSNDWSDPSTLAEGDLEISGSVPSLLAVEYAEAIGTLMKEVLASGIKKRLGAIINDLSVVWSDIADTVEEHTCPGDECPWCDGVWGEHSNVNGAMCPGYHIERYLESKETVPVLGQGEE